MLIINWSRVTRTTRTKRHVVCTGYGLIIIDITSMPILMPRYRCPTHVFSERHIINTTTAKRLCPLSILLHVRLRLHTAEQLVVLVHHCPGSHAPAQHGVLAPLLDICQYLHRLFFSLCLPHGHPPGLVRDRFLPRKLVLDRLSPRSVVRRTRCPLADAGTAA